MMEESVVGKIISKEIKKLLPRGMDVTSYYDDNNTIETTIVINERNRAYEKDVFDKLSSMEGSFDGALDTLGCKIEEVFETNEDGYDLGNQDILLKKLKDTNVANIIIHIDIPSYEDLFELMAKYAIYSK